jgi:LmbE family N-acetylglucosaminyl deacetylase
MDIIDDILQGLNVVFIGAHPDDECLVGPLLAFAADYSSASVLCLTKGESGRNLRQGNNQLTLGAVRQEELAKGCVVLGVACRTLDYTNGRSKAHPQGIAVAEDEKQSSARWQKTNELSEDPDNVLQRWTREAGDPCPEVEKAIREAAPCIVITFDTATGSGHPEHIAVGRIVEKCVAEIRASGEAQGRMELWLWVGPHRAVLADVRVAVDDLHRLGRREYLQLGLQARSLHESQFGPLGSAKNERFSSHLRPAIEQMIFRKSHGTDCRP